MRVPLALSPSPPVSVHSPEAARRGRAVGVGVAALVVLLTGRVARAEQFVLVDEVYTHAGGSHHNLKRAPGVPDNWKTPIDYTNGRAYFRLEVLKKPNATSVMRFGMCMNRTNPSTCSGQGRFSTTGVFEWSGDLPWSYHVGAYDWTLPPTALRARVTDTNNRNLDKGEPFVGAPDLGLYLPMDVRFTVWIVTRGAKLDRSGLPPAPTPTSRPKDAGAAPGLPRDGGAGGTASTATDASGGGDPVTPPGPLGPPGALIDGGPPGTTPDPPQGEDATPTPAAERHGGCHYGGRAGGGPLGLALSLLGWLGAASFFSPLRRRLRHGG